MKRGGTEKSKAPPKDVKEAPIMRATRDGYGDGLLEVGKTHPNVVVLCPDVSESTRSIVFKKAFPDRFVQLGVSEQAGVSIAAGLALAGKIPFIASYATFSPGRSWEQVRTNFCLNDVHGIIVGAHAGVSVGPDGATHQALEDIALMRPLPNMTIIVPSDSEEARKATIAAADAKGPVYLRLTREASPACTKKNDPFEIGKASTLRNGNDVAIIGCGPILHEALLAADTLKENGIRARVINMSTVKPLDETTVLQAAEECGAVVTIEEHATRGGLGSAIAEFLSETRPTPMAIMGTKQFGESGTPQELYEKHKLTAAWIAKRAQEVMARKRRGQ